MFRLYSSTVPPIGQVSSSFPVPAVGVSRGAPLQQLAVQIKGVTQVEEQLLMMPGGFCDAFLHVFWGTICVGCWLADEYVRTCSNVLHENLWVALLAASSMNCCIAKVPGAPRSISPFVDWMLMLMVKQRHKPMNLMTPFVYPFFFFC